jgi:hypothetical protein
MNHKAEQARHWRAWYRTLADLLDEALAEAERVAEAEGGLDFPMKRLGKLLIELGAGAHALHEYLVARLDAAPASRLRRRGQRPKDELSG